MIIKEITEKNEAVELTPEDKVILLRVLYKPWRAKVDRNVAVFHQNRLVAASVKEVHSFTTKAQTYQQFEVRFSELAFEVDKKNSFLPTFAGTVLCYNADGIGHRISFWLRGERSKVVADKVDSYDRICLMLGLHPGDNLEEFVENLKKERDELVKCRDFVKINW